MTTKTLEQMVSEAEQRLEEIKPVYEEYLEIVRFLLILRFAKVEPPKPQRTPNGRPIRRRPVGTGNRHHQTMRLLSDNGPMTINEIAAHLRIQPHYLYRMLPIMQERGQVARNGRTWDLAGPLR